MLIKANAQSQKGYVVQLGLMQVLLVSSSQLRLLLLDKSLLLRALVCADFYMHLVCHYPVVSELYRLVESETVCDLFWLLQLEFHNNLIKLQDIELFLINFLLGFWLFLFKPILFIRLHNIIH